MPEFVIREATDEDGPALARLMAETVKGGPSEEVSERPELERPASSFAERGGRLWLVFSDGEAVGSLGLTAHGRPKEFELSMICLSPETRGQGLAAALLAGANAFAAASGGERLSLWVDVALDDVQRFCERQGFIREPGARARHDGTGALECRFSRAVAV